MSSEAGATVLVDDCDQHRRFVADSEFVELRWPAATRVALDAVADPVHWERDRGLGPASPQVKAVAARVVRLVGPHPVRALARPAESQLRNPDGFQDRFEERGAAPLPGRNQERQRAVNAPHLVALVRAGARFERGQLVVRPEVVAA